MIDAADQLNLPLKDISRSNLRKLAFQLGEALPEEFLGLSSMLAWVEGAAAWPKISSEHPAYFYTLRARPGPNRDLVNMLLSELSLKDVRQLFITHKERFYQEYRLWSEAKRGLVADVLAREYQVDKQGARAALFGPEPSMDDTVAPSRSGLGAARAHARQAQKIRSGPWGSYRG